MAAFVAGDRIEAGARDPAAPVLTAAGLTFRRGDQTVVDGVDLEIQPGERLALVGPSGAGKTTLLRLLAGLETPQLGSVTVAAGSRDSRVRVGLLFQDLGLFPHMRVRSNVAFPLLARGVPRSERRGQAQEALERAGLGAYADRFPHRLSGGERQRVAIVRTLLSEPAVVLLDEPFASLDPHLLDRFADWLGDVQTDTGVPMVVVTHDVPFALRWARRVVVLQDGRVQQEGEPTEVYRHPATAFVAGFLGPANLIDATVIATGDGTVRCELPGFGPVEATTAGGLAVGEPCRVVLRPYDLRLAEPGGGLAGRVSDVRFAGGAHDVTVEVAGASLRVAVPPGETPAHRGDAVAVRWPPEIAHAVRSR